MLDVGIHPITQAERDELIKMLHEMVKDLEGGNPTSFLILRPGENDVRMYTVSTLAERASYAALMHLVSKQIMNELDVDMDLTSRPPVAEC